MYGLDIVNAKVAETCDICGCDLFSMTTRRIGDNSLCRNCADLYIPSINAYIKAFVKNRRKEFIKGAGSETSHQTGEQQ